MNTTQQNLEALKDIRNMMERSSRFISLSGWSGIAAGCCALAGAWLADGRISRFKAETSGGYEAIRNQPAYGDPVRLLERDLLALAVGVFIVAGIAAFIFTYIKSKKEGMAIGGTLAQRLMWNTLLPMAAGGAVILRMIQTGQHFLIAPVSLIFYGLALVNGSKYTLGEIRYLGYIEITLGIVNLWMPGYGLGFWALGFGILHIVYGAAMWWKYDR